MKISIKHHTKTKIQKRSVQSIDAITAKAAKKLISIIRDGHRTGFNINDEYMSDLGEIGDGYSPQYRRYKRRYDNSSYDSGMVNLRSSGRFHRGLRIRRATVQGESGYYVHSVRPLPPTYPGTKVKHDNYKDIFAYYETFKLSSSNRQQLTDILKESKKTILQSILYSR